MKAFARVALGVCVLCSILVGIAYASTTVANWGMLTFPPNTERTLVTQRKDTTRSYANCSITSGTAGSLWVNVKYNGNDVATTEKVYNNGTAYRINYLSQYASSGYGQGLICAVVARQTGVFNETAKGQARTN